ncbi:hypothetical protein FOZ62_008967 [Perkinsus olseni]|uniref:Uncharacterized protein n=1 Tax=Perkinsus olseni TaxID=32597 RepID=A0A7J6PUY7_PEROL|nr:hypothetical protein FOZ62_008967 [Perkinsus olseni]
MNIRLITSLSSLASLVGGTKPADYGNFVYQTQDVKMTLDASADGNSQFSVECSSRFEDSFQLQPAPLGDLEEIEGITIHLFPPPSSPDSLRETWVPKIHAACPQLTVEDTDLLFFEVNNEGNLETELGGAKVVLKRQWGELSAGRYLSDKALSELRLHKGDHYELTPIDGHDTVEDLIDSFQQACPLWFEFFNFDKDFRIVRFANPDTLYAMGGYLHERLFKHPV